MSTHSASLAFMKGLSERLELRNSKHGGKYCTGKQTDSLLLSNSEISRKPFYKLRSFEISSQHR